MKNRADIASSIQLDDIKDCITSIGKKNWIALCGGEPTLHEEFLKIIDFIEDSGFTGTKLCTNGRTLSDLRLCDQLVDAGIRVYEVDPILGHNANLHNLYTRTEDSFEETILGIANLRSREVFVSARIVVTEQNFTFVEEMVDLVGSLLVDRIILSFDKSLIMIADAIPFVQRGIDLSMNNKIWIMTENIPLEWMKGYEYNTNEFYTRENG
jgi:MoaA/NifB/PqqE/SkfB family radical SAM enzyme